MAKDYNRFSEIDARGAVPIGGPQPAQPIQIRDDECWKVIAGDMVVFCETASDFGYNQVGAFVIKEAYSFIDGCVVKFKQLSICTVGERALFFHIAKQPDWWKKRSSAIRA
jgi:hypothetical protein